MQPLATGKFDRNFLFHIFLVSLREQWAGVRGGAGDGEPGKSI
jgi:hypothetical protein